MSKSIISDYRAFHKLTKRLTTVVGLWPYENSCIFYRLLPYFQISLNLILVLAMLGFVCKHFSNISLVTSSLSIMTTFMTVIIKLFCLVVNRKDLTELHKNLDPYFNELLNHSKLSKLIYKKMNIFKSISWTLFALSICYYTNEMKTKKYRSICPSDLCKITSNRLFYQIYLAFETLASFESFFVTTAADSLFMLYVFQIIAKLREISHCITHIKDKNENSVVGKYVSQYVKLIRCRDLLEKIYGPIILWIMGTNTIVFCSLLFQISQIESISIVQGLLLIMCIALKMIQIFMYSWSGSWLTEESEDCRDAVYAANWYGNKRLMTSVVIILMQRPLTLTLYNFSSVSVRNFITVFNAAISYFFSLQSLTSNEQK
ncbi:odorant receptor 4-like [Microplitis demolitor]|uniref:odorant receptor 4-like n=1 Tax=Microplitis demolitor TaxID=69319 RepID=UPI00235B633E|nr:odorant receptor 4-like [Microplitis demolitor]